MRGAVSLVGLAVWFGKGVEDKGGELCSGEGVGIACGSARHSIEHLMTEHSFLPTTTSELV